MTPQLALCAGCLLASAALAQSGAPLLVQTRLHPSALLEAGQSMELDLRDFFQFYPAPGPVATVTIRMPVAAGRRSFELNGRTVQLMTYQLASGESYDDPFAVRAGAFAWTEQAIQYQLLADKAPVTVANFLTYVAGGWYANTIVHRNESTGLVFRPGGQQATFRLPIIQAGGWRLPDSGPHLLELIPKNPPIVLEQTIDNSRGTLAMARSLLPDTATSEFFINLDDNTNRFGKAYAVFGELMDPDAAMAVLTAFADAPVYDLSTPYPSDPPNVFPELPNVFPNLPFTSIPLYAPFWDDPDSYSRIAAISVPPGDPDGVSYAWAFVDEDGVQGVSEEEAANRAVFDIRLQGSLLTVDRTDTGAVTIEVTGTGHGQEARFSVRLTAFHPNALNALAVFAGAAVSQGALLKSGWFGLFNADAYPYLRHTQHGHQYVGSASSPLWQFLYDFNLGEWLYTTPAAYPYLYSAARDAWLFFVKETGDGTAGSRWFYDSSAKEWFRG